MRWPIDDCERDTDSEPACQVVLLPGAVPSLDDPKWFKIQITTANIALEVGANR
jgi:hypothetical protein